MKGNDLSNEKKKSAFEKEEMKREKGRKKGERR